MLWSISFIPNIGEDFHQFWTSPYETKGWRLPTSWRTLPNMECQLVFGFYIFFHSNHENESLIHISCRFVSCDFFSSMASPSPWSHQLGEIPVNEMEQQRFLFSVSGIRILQIPCNSRIDPPGNNTYLEPKWPLLWLEKTLFWRVQPPKYRTHTHTHRLQVSK